MYDPTCIEFNCEFRALVALLQKRGFKREQAIDAASEAMACAYQKWSRIDRSLRGWLLTAAFHIACRQAQRAREEHCRAVAGGWGPPLTATLT